MSTGEFDGVKYKWTKQSSSIGKTVGVHASRVFKLASHTGDEIKADIPWTKMKHIASIPNRNNSEV
jgi:hypothetical protein